MRAGQRIGIFRAHLKQTFEFLEGFIHIAQRHGALFDDVGHGQEFVEVGAHRKLSGFLPNLRDIGLKRCFIVIFGKDKNLTNLVTFLIKPNLFQPTQGQRK